MISEKLAASLYVASCVQRLSNLVKGSRLGTLPTHKLRVGTERIIGPEIFPLLAGHRDIISTSQCPRAAF